MKKSRLFFLGTVLVLVGSAQSPGQGKLTPDQIEKVHSHLFHKGPSRTNSRHAVKGHRRRAYSLRRCSRTANLGDP